MHYRQKADECLDDFVNRCNLQALKCEFSPAELNERIIEQLIASTPILDFQKEFLQKDKGFTMDQTLAFGRTYEAAESHIKGIQSIGATPSVDYVQKDSHPACTSCGTHHSKRRRQACPAYGTKFTTCGKNNHWSNVCRSSSQNAPIRHSSRRLSRTRHSQRQRMKLMLT
ncbi:hypothetical protein SNE40_014185 [Patella caerulea]|uniref:Uncharacterized protein n=1 Tax=Patella caerulea TaxID=87958 RepID=A0AAN8JF62_PATCE